MGQDGIAQRETIALCTERICADEVRSDSYPLGRLKAGRISIVLIIHSLDRCAHPTT